MNEIVSLPLDGSAEPQVLAGGRDFYSFPRISPDGAWLAWTCWDHPNMPWDGTELWVAPLADSGEERLVAGGAEESVFQPEWGPDGRLYFVSDRDGWWNLYRAREPGAELSGEEGTLVQLTEERGRLRPSRSGCSAAPPTRSSTSGAIACVRCEGAEERLFLLQPEGWEPADLGLPFTSFGYPVLAARGEAVAFAAASPESETAVVRPRRRARARPRSCAPPARSRSTPPTSRARGRSSSRPATARSPTASTTRRRTRTSRRRRGNCRR